MAIKLGLIGYPLGHSFSKTYFSEKFEKAGITDQSYENYPIADIRELPSLIHSNPDLIGLNVTIPYKEQVLPFLHEIDSEAAQAGAVNTIRIQRSNGEFFLKGYNTDIYGFAMSIKPFLLSSHYRALILGNGGASKAVVAVFKKLGIDYRIVSRNPSQGQLQWNELNKDMIRHFPVIVNTTPLGMHPHVEDCPPLPFEGIDASHFCVDLIYNPEKTIFLKRAEERGAVVLNGLTMLKLQAEKAYEIFMAE
jgi:shikimate dehydrogenase